MPVSIQKIKFPFYAKFTFLVLLLVLLCYIISAGSDVIMPIILSLIMAILLRPVVHFLTKRLRIPHVLSVLVTVTLFIILIIVIVSLISWQVGDFAEDLPTIKKNLVAHYHDLQSWIKAKFNISYTKQNSYLKNITKDSFNGENILAKDTINSFSQTILKAMLIPVYTFLILLYRNLFKKFLLKLINPKDQQTLMSILGEIRIVIQSYLVGLIIEMGVVAGLMMIGLMIVKVPYVVLLGLITAVLNLIPYVGVLIAGCIAIMVALTTSTDFSTVAGVVIVMWMVQLFDNNILIPKIVGSKVKVNALVSLVGVVAGGALAGIMGMFLAIPVIAIMKCIFDRIDDLKPWGYLMGDEMPKTYRRR
jgi:predicted PurR-regulated permease PerM